MGEWTDRAEELLEAQGLLFKMKARRGESPRMKPKAEQPPEPSRKPKSKTSKPRRKPAVIKVTAVQSKHNPAFFKIKVSTSYRGDKVKGETHAINFGLESADPDSQYALRDDRMMKTLIRRGGKDIPYTLRRKIEDTVRAELVKQEKAYRKKYKHYL